MVGPGTFFPSKPFTTPACSYSTTFSPTRTTKPTQTSCWPSSRNEGPQSDHRDNPGKPHRMIQIRHDKPIADAVIAGAILNRLVIGAEIIKIEVIKIEGRRQHTPDPLPLSTAPKRPGATGYSPGRYSVPSTIAFLERSYEQLVFGKPAGFGDCEHHRSHLPLDMLKKPLTIVHAPLIPSPPKASGRQTSSLRVGN